jgi:hypothetical protein
MNGFKLALRTWTPAADARLLRLRGQGQGWDPIARALSRSARACKERYARLVPGGAVKRPAGRPPAQPGPVGLALAAAARRRLGRTAPHELWISQMLHLGLLAEAPTWRPLT